MKYSFFRELLDSVVTVVEDKDGFPALHMNNVCYNMETMEIELFCKSSCDVPDRPSCIIISPYTLVFRTPGWKFSMITTKNNRWLFKEKGSYLLIPESTNLDIVAMNISSFIIHLIQSISSFPVVFCLCGIHYRFVRYCYQPSANKVPLFPQFSLMVFGIYYRIQLNSVSFGKKT